eukprot:scaffold2896_cov76-Skeletonema_dohrnii-CCMP3373.AAC.1
MVKGMQFLIDDSYTMDDEIDDDDPSPSSSPPPPQSNENGNLNVKMPPAPENPSSQLAYAEEKKSDTPNNSVGSSNVLGDAVMSDEHDNGSDEQQEFIDAETTNSTASMITPQSSNLHDESQTINDSSTAVTINNANANEQQQPTKSTMAMVKLRVWDPAAPSKQFKFITATTVLLLPQDDNHNDDSSNAIDTTDLSNNDGNILAPKKYQDSRNQKRLSV